MSSFIQLLHSRIGVQGKKKKIHATHYILASDILLLKCICPMGKNYFPMTPHNKEMHVTGPTLTNTEKTKKQIIQNWF